MPRVALGGRFTSSAWRLAERLVTTSTTTSPTARTAGYVSTSPRRRRASGTVRVARAHQLRAPTTAEARLRSEIRAPQCCPERLQEVRLLVREAPTCGGARLSRTEWRLAGSWHQTRRRRHPLRCRFQGDLHLGEVPREGGPCCELWQCNSPRRSETTPVAGRSGAGE